MTRRKLKVYGAMGFRTPPGGRRVQSREVVAASSKATAYALFGRLVGARDIHETGNAAEVELALAKPGCVFWTPFGDHLRPDAVWHEVRDLITEAAEALKGKPDGR